MLFAEAMRKKIDKTKFLLFLCCWLNLEIKNCAAEESEKIFCANQTSIFIIEHYERQRGRGKKKDSERESSEMTTAVARRPMF
jgi:hypothetical protein